MEDIAMMCEAMEFASEEIMRAGRDPLKDSNYRAAMLAFSFQDKEKCYEYANTAWTKAMADQGITSHQLT